MPVTTESATVYRAGGRRYFSKRSACLAQARHKIKERCECDYCDHPEMPGAWREDLPCKYHNGSAWSEKVKRRLARVYMRSLG